MTWFRGHLSTLFCWLFLCNSVFSLSPPRISSLLISLFSTALPFCVSFSASLVSVSVQPSRPRPPRLHPRWQSQPPGWPSVAAPHVPGRAAPPHPVVALSVAAMLPACLLNRGS